MPTSISSPSRNPRYGVDAPGVIFFLLSGGAAALAVAVATGRLVPAWWGTALWIVSGAIALVLLVLGTCMLLYAMTGKFRVRDHMLGLIAWRGDEQVLDIGTGRGLLAVGAAKRLSTGRVTGIDIWQAKDLSGNGAVGARANAAAEGVAGRILIEDGDIRRTRFADGTFDVVLSLLCLHNIEDRAERDAACHEIARVLRPGGQLVVGDYVPTHRYAAVFRESGLTVESSRSRFAQALGLMWIVRARKPA